MDQIKISYLEDPGIQKFLKPSEDGGPRPVVIKYTIPRIDGEFNETLFNTHENNKLHPPLKSLLGDRGIGLAYYGDHKFQPPDPLPDDLSNNTSHFNTQQLNEMEMYNPQLPPSSRYSSRVKPGRFANKLKQALKQYAVFFNDGDANFKKHKHASDFTKDIGFDNSRDSTKSLNNLTAEYLLHLLQLGNGDGDKLKRQILANILDANTFDGWDTGLDMAGSMSIAGYTFTVIDDFRTRQNPQFLPSVEYLYLYAIYRAPFIKNNTIPIPISYALVAQPKEDSGADSLFLIGVFNSPYGILRYYNAITSDIFIPSPAQRIYPRGTALTMMRIINADLNSQGTYKYMGMDALLNTRYALMNRKQDTQTAENPRVQLYRYQYYYQDTIDGKWYMWPLSSKQYEQKEDNGVLPSATPIGAGTDNPQQPNLASLGIANELEDPHFIRLEDLNAYTRVTVVASPLCNQCGQNALYLCGSCLVATYCSTKCQRKDWAREHQKQCQ